MLRFLVVPSVLLLVACSSATDSSAPIVSAGEITDAQVSALARAATGWTYYKNRPDTLLRSAQSAHAGTRLRTRFNTIASTQLDAAGKIRSGAVFPDSALIVKELIDGNTLIRYVVMLKLRNSANASAGGWLWAYYAPDGATQISITGRGASCAGCHAVGVDYTRMGDSHP
ncbi:MAG: hypothetical protein H7Z40_23035 [Phycisphaerae bacterium]|nr:hypothetical protein [Gemmatimonadaceae bacterium]